jgi:Glycosyltransferase family 87
MVESAAPSSPLALRRITGRTVFFFCVVIGLSVIGWLLQRDGWRATWERWGMVSREPAFADLRVVTGATDSLDTGYNPTIENPGAPFGQLFNYPRIWLFLLRLLGINGNHSVAVGILLVLGTLATLWWITRGIGQTAAFYCAAIFFSPAVMLAVERGNTDLLMFFLLGVAFVRAERSIATSCAFVVAAFMLKLFPLAGVLLVLREPRRRALRLAGLVLAAAAVYIAITFEDLGRIAAATEKGADVSYGYNVLWMFLRLYQSPWTGFAQAAAVALVIVALGLAWWRGARGTGSEPTVTRALDGYRLGAGVYAGTFLLGNNWDYRLLFFFFAVPQLFHWLQRGRPFERCMAAGQLGAYLTATWSMALYPLLVVGYYNPAYGSVRTLEEFAKWGLFLSSLCLLADTLPSWARAGLSLRFKPDGAVRGEAAPR